jgi:ABC-type multidrug transport system fused ATPase/permease subunit
VILGLESIYDVLTALEKLGEVTDLPLEKQDGQPVARSSDEGGPMAIELRGVGFRSHWSGTPILNAVDLKIAPGEKVCISGPDGSGKSTLLQIIAGMVDPDEGSVIIDGQGLRSLCPKHLRSAMGDSFSQEDLFTGTVLENIMMGRPWITEAHAREAAARVGLMPMLTDLPDGLLTMLDPLGSRLPRSLMKRIIVARCIAGRPRLVLFEDDALPIAAREQETLLELLTGVDAPFTLIAVSNDPDFRAHCSQLLRIEDGRLVEEGSARSSSQN